MKDPQKPMNFVQEVRTGDHVVLFYEDRAYAEKIKFRFLEDGLERGESCVITTHGSAAGLTKRLARGGIDVHRYSKDGLLHVLKIEDPMASPDGPANSIRETYRQIFSLVEEPYRVVSTTFKAVGESEAYSREIQLEKKAQKTFNGGDPENKRRVFHDMEGTIMCTYHVDDFGPGNMSWLKTLSANHHAVIFAPSKTDGVAFRMTATPQPAA